MAKATSPRGGEPAGGAVSFGPFRLYAAQQLLLEADAPVAVGSRALDILAALVERAGELVTKEELFARVWPDVTVDESNLRAQIAALRRALRDGRDGARYVATVPGRGYRFVGAISASTAQVAGDEAARPPPPQARLTRTVGRGDVVRAVSSRLQRRRFITIVGPGGIGKTTVALSVEDEVSPSYPDGVCSVDLAAIGDPRRVPSALASALGLSIVSEDPTSACVDFLHDRSMLVVLDGCEHVVEAAAVLAEQLLTGARDVHVLATSREPLRAEGESVQRLGPLDVPPRSASLTAAAALTFSSVQLFVERAAAAADGFELSDADAPHVAEICRQLDGIALAIELVAGRVAAFGVADVAARLDDRFRLLTSGRRTALPRHQTLSAALDWSYEYLPAPEQVILRRLAVFAGYFALESASAVASDGELGDCEVVDAIESLVAKSLLVADVSRAVGSYRFLDTTRAYALEKLAASGERDRIARRHAEHYLDLVQQAAGEWERGRPLAEWLASHARHADNVRVALDWAFSPGGDAQLGVALTVAAIPLWFQLPLIDECFARVQQALASVGPGPRRDAHTAQAMQLLAALGLSRALATGFAPDAIEAFTRALGIAESVGDTENQLGMLYGLWTCRFATGAFRTALTLGRRFADLSAKVADPADQLIGDRLIGIALHYLGEHDAARVHLERMLTSYVAPMNRPPTIRFQSDQRVLARATLGRILWMQGLADQARSAARQAVEDARETGHPISMHGALTQAECPIALLLGDFEMAERSLASLREETAGYGLGPWSVMGRSLEGVLRIAQGDVASGLPMLRSGIAELSRGHMRIDMLLLASLAEAQGISGAAFDGLATVEQALERATHDEERWCRAELLRVKGELRLRLRAPDAEKILLESLEEARDQRALAWELRSATSLARLWRDLGRARDAREVLAPVHERFREGLDTTDWLAAKSLLDALS